MSADHEVRRAHRRKSFQSVGGCIALLSHRKTCSILCVWLQITFRFRKSVVFFFDESHFEVREADSVYVVSETRGRERVRTMSGGVVRSFLVVFVTGQAVSSQFFPTA